MDKYAEVTFLVLAFIASYGIDRHLHRQNIGVLRDCGGEEIAKPLSLSFYRLNYYLFGFILLETLMNLWSFPKELRLLGALVIGLGAWLRLWSIYTLGQLWTRRCIYVAGVKRVVQGPYRWLNHPEYLGRILESIGLCLFLETPIVGLFTMPIMMMSALKLAKVESRQIEELSHEVLADANLG